MFCCLVVRSEEGELPQGRVRPQGAPCLPPSQPSQPSRPPISKESLPPSVLSFWAGNPQPQGPTPFPPPPYRDPSPWERPRAQILENPLVPAGILLFLLDVGLRPPDGGQLRDLLSGKAQSLQSAAPGPAAPGPARRRHHARAVRRAADTHSPPRREARREKEPPESPEENSRCVEIKSSYLNTPSEHHGVSSLQV